MQESIRFHVSDERLDRITPFQFSANTVGHPAFLAGFEHLNTVNVVTAIPEVDITPLGMLPG